MYRRRRLQQRNWCCTGMCARKNPFHPAPPPTPEDELYWSTIWSSKKRSGGQPLAPDHCNFFRKLICVMSVSSFQTTDPGPKTALWWWCRRLRNLSLDPELSFAVANGLNASIQAGAAAVYVSLWEYQCGNSEGYKDA